MVNWTRLLLALAIISQNCFGQLVLQVGSSRTLKTLKDAQTAASGNLNVQIILDDERFFSRTSGEAFSLSGSNTSSIKISGNNSSNPSIIDCGSFDVQVFFLNSFFNFTLENLVFENCAPTSTLIQIQQMAFVSISGISLSNLSFKGTAVLLSDVTSAVLDTLKFLGSFPSNSPGTLLKAKNLNLASSASFTLKNSIIQNHLSNSSATNGPLLLETISNILISNCTFEGNKGTFSVVQIKTPPSLPCSWVIDSCSIRNNTLSNALVISIVGNSLASSVLTVSNSTFEDNTQSNNPAIFPSFIHSNLIGNTFKNNKNTGSAGAVLLSRADFSCNMTDNLFQNNEATASAAVSIFTPGLVTPALSVWRNCQFLNNTATSGDGGAVRITGHNLTMSNCQFSGNIAATFGGALTMELSTIAISRSVFTQNSAPKGGGVYCFNTHGTFNFTEPSIFNNNQNDLDDSNCPSAGTLVCTWWGLGLPSNPATFNDFCGSRSCVHDACTVCGGDGQSCAGCDGVAYSGKELIDTCLGQLCMNPNDPLPVCSQTTGTTATTGTTGTTATIGTTGTTATTGTTGTTATTGTTGRDVSQLDGAASSTTRTIIISASVVGGIVVIAVTAIVVVVVIMKNRKKEGKTPDDFTVL